MVRSEAERAAINTPIQTISNDCALLAGVVGCECKVINAVDRLGLFIHDELVFEVEESRAAQMAADIKGIMENLPTERFNCVLDVPLIADVKIGYNLADMEDFGGWNGR